MNWKSLTVRFCMLVLLAILPMSNISCVLTGKTAKQTAQPAVPKIKPVKVGFYVDDGSRNCGVLYWARLLAYSPQLEVTLLEADDIHSGKLNGLDLLVIPGGSSTRQCAKLKRSGMEIVRKFVADGGSYFGICAGFHCTLNRPERMRLLPFEYITGAGGNVAVLPVDISERGAKLLGIDRGRYHARYSHGPIARPGKEPGVGWGEVLGVYKGTVSPVGRPGGNFFDAPAIIHGRFGKGRVIATSFHPESNESTWAIGFGCIYAVTKVKPVPVFPKKQYRPVRVAFWAPAIVGKRCIQEWLELDRQPDLDLNPVSHGELNQGILSHSDVLIMTDGREEVYKALMDNRFMKDRITDFLNRGGRVLASGCGGKFLPQHKNVKILPVGESFVSEARRRP